MSGTLSDRAYLRISQNNAKALQKMAQTFTREQWQWEKSMSGSAHQREVADLQKAGLNPVLSSGGSGASYTSTSGDSGASASSSVLSSGLSSMAQMRSAKLSANASNYAARMNYRAAQASAAAQVRAASIAAGASMYTADQNLEGTKYNADNNKQSWAGVLDKYLGKIIGSLHLKGAGNVIGTQTNKIFSQLGIVKPVGSNAINRYNFRANMNVIGRNYINAQCRAVGIKKPNINQFNLMARYLYTQNNVYRKKLVNSVRDYGNSKTSW